ncbi:hypothetical protein BSLG_000600 [Batrachochytrium salamandrivorans]|nr:hypothetical protein BSLG_000600 [Batrachochytrium salamandrivorans]
MDTSNRTIDGAAAYRNPQARAHTQDIEVISSSDSDVSNETDSSTEYFSAGEGELEPEHVCAISTTSLKSQVALQSFVPAYLSRHHHEVDHHAANDLSNHLKSIRPFDSEDFETIVPRPYKSHTLYPSIRPTIPPNLLHTIVDPIATPTKQIDLSNVRDSGSDTHSLESELESPIAPPRSTIGRRAQLICVSDTESDESTDLKSSSLIGGMTREHLPSEEIPLDFYSNSSQHSSLNTDSPILSHRDSPDLLASYSAQKSPLLGNPGHHIADKLINGEEHEDDSDDEDIPLLRYNRKFNRQSIVLKVSDEESISDFETHKPAAKVQQAQEVIVISSSDEDEDSLHTNELQRKLTMASLQSPEKTQTIQKSSDLSKNRNVPFCKPKSQTGLLGTDQVYDLNDAFRAINIADTHQQSDLIKTFEGTPKLERVTKDIWLPHLSPEITSSRLPNTNLATRKNAPTIGLKNKEKLTVQLFHEFNKRVFFSGLPSDMQLEWSIRLNKTAGRTHTHSERNNSGELIRVARIELASKVLDTEERLRNTLMHELCHAACWIIDGDNRNPHGKLFKRWGDRAMYAYEDITVTTCHSYEISYKYSYVCTNEKCGRSLVALKKVVMHPQAMAETLSLSRVFTAAAAVVALSSIGYIIYFDYKRNSSPEFRRRIKEQRRTAQKILANRNAQVQAAVAALRRAGGEDPSGMFELEDEPMPTTAQEAQAYFSKYLMMGENLMSRGPAGYEAAAVCFYRSLKVHPEAVTIFEAFEKSLPSPILDLIVQLMSADVRSAQPGVGTAASLEEVE